MLADIAKVMKRFDSKIEGIEAVRNSDGSVVLIDRRVTYHLAELFYGKGLFYMSPKISESEIYNELLSIAVSRFFPYTEEFNQV